MSEHRLSEIVIERPRGGMRISSRKLKGSRKQLNKLTEEASQDGLLSPYLIKPRNKSKYLSDHLGPLRRFLRSHVGQSWNDVYSKLCQQLDSSTMAGQHVLSHLWDYVERHAEIIDGVPYSKPYCGHWRRLGNHSRDRFYVHPETGLLCASEKNLNKRKQPQDRSKVVILDGDRQYHKLNDLWYLISFEAFPADPAAVVTDVLLGAVSRSNAGWIGNRRVYAARKRQCNKKEIRFIMNQLAKQ